MSTYVHDSFTGTSGSDILAHAGQVGASWTRHPAQAEGTSNFWLISDQGRARSIAGGYVAAHYIASGVLPSADCDVLADMHFFLHTGDASHGISFRHSATVEDGYRLLWDDYVGNRRWVLQKVVGGSATALGTYAQVLTDGADYSVRVELRSTGIAVKIDGVSRITSSDTTYTAGGRVGLYAVGDTGSTDATGMHIDALAAVDPGDAMPDLSVAATSWDIYDTFYGWPVNNVQDHIGQVGSAWTRHPSQVASGSNYWQMSQAGRAYATPGSYSVAHYLASAVIAAGDHDILCDWHLFSHLGDTAHGISFRHSATVESGYRLLYDGYVANRRWKLERVDAGVTTVLATYSDDITAGSDRSVRVELRSTGITVKIDGVSRITSSDTTYTGSGRVGLYAIGDSGGTETTGMHLDRIAVGPAAAVAPGYELEGPPDGTPGTDSLPFQVKLAAGTSPGAVTITPTAVGMTGTFTPTSIALDNTTRSGTFTFKPTGTAPATGSIGSTNSAALIAPPAAGYAATLGPIPYMSNWVGVIHFTYPGVGPNPFVPGPGWNAEGNEHYDAAACVVRAQALCERLPSPPTDWSVARQYEIDRYRDSAVIPSGGGLVEYHKFSRGLAEHFRDSGEFLSRDAMEMMVSSAVPFYGGVAADYKLDYEIHANVRPQAFQLLNMLDNEWTGLGVHPLVHQACDNLLSMCDQWTAPTGTYFSVWSKPFMTGLALRALIDYYSRYQSDTTPSIAARVALIPGRVRAVCDFLWTSCFWAYGTPASIPTGWPYGAIGYQIPDTTVGAGGVPTIAGVVVASNSGNNRIVIGPASLSSVTDYYKWCLLEPEDPANGDGSVIIGYDGPTRTFTLNPHFGPGAPLPAGSTFRIKSTAEADNGPGPTPELNPMVSPAFAWVYWHLRRVAGDAAGAMEYRRRHDVVFAGQTASHGNISTIKQWNQIFYWGTDGFRWRDRGDAAWPAATTFALQAPTPGAAGAASVESAPFRLSVPYGQELSGAVTVTPSSSTGRGTFNPATAILSTERPQALFTFTPDPLDDGTVVAVGASVAGLSAPVAVSYSVGDVGLVGSGDPVILILENSVGGILLLEDTRP